MTTLLELRDMLDAATGPLDYVSACDAVVSSGFQDVETVRLLMLALQGSIDAALAMEWLQDKRRLPTIFYGTNGDALTDDIIDSIIAACSDAG